MNKISSVIFGCRFNTCEFINSLDKKKYNIEKIITISKKTAKLNKVSGYYDLGKLPNNLNRKIISSSNYSLKLNKSNILKSKRKYDLGFSVGWQRIIPTEILNKFKYGVYGMHCSKYKLPNGRGRSPINWSIIKGSTYLYCNIFKYNKNIDDGDLVYFEKLFFSENEDINTIQQKLSFVFSNFVNIKKDFYKNKKKQKKTKNIIYFKKRSSRDGEINLYKFTAKKLHNFIRAQTTPYPGAYIVFKNKKYRLYKSSYFKFKMHKKNERKIVKIYLDGSFLIYLKNYLIHILDHEIPRKVLQNMKNL